jgi:hypothetical protein
MPRPTDPDREDHLQLYEPMPVYITYLTAAPDGAAALFRPDPYGRDAKVLARFADKQPTMRDARPQLTIDFDALSDEGENGKASKAKPPKRQDIGKPAIKSPKPPRSSQPPTTALQQGRGFHVVTLAGVARQMIRSATKERN